MNRNLLGLMIIFMSYLFGCNLGSNNYPIYYENDSVECGPICLKMISKYYGKELSLDSLSKLSNMDTLEGTTMRGLSDACEIIGFRTLAAKIPFQVMDKDSTDLFDAPLPGILHWQNNYFIVLYELNNFNATIGHPKEGLVKMGINQFKRNWLEGKEDDKGIILLLETNDKF